MKIATYIILVFIFLVTTTIKAQDFYTRSPGEFYAKDQIIEPITYDYYGDTSTIELVADTLITTLDKKEYLLTAHGKIYTNWTPHIVRPYSVAIYLKVNGKYQNIIKRRPSGLFYYGEPPYYLKMKPVNSDETVELILFTMIEDGTGRFPTEIIYQILPSGKLKKVLFTSARESYRKYLNKGENLMRGEWNSLSEKGLSFFFYIYKNTDYGANPTAGVVNGTYVLKKIEHDNYDYEIIMDSHKREKSPYKEWRGKSED